MNATSSRRQFLKTSSLIMAAALLPTISGCSGFEPRPFNVGAEVKPPLGCEQLLKRDTRGDC